MLSKLKEFFSPPIFGDDEKKTNTARILFLAIKFYYSLSVLILIGDIFLFVRKLQIVMLILFFLIVLSTAKSLAQKGRVQTASNIIVIYLWCMYTPAIWLSGGVTSEMAVAYIIISIMAGLLLGRWASISISVVSCFSLLVMYLLESFSIYSPKYFPFPPRSVLFLWYSSFFIIVPTINLALQILREALTLKRKEVEERKGVEEALRESENKFRKIFENVRDIFYQVDLNGIIIDITPSIFRYSGYSREELVGKPVELIYYNPGDRLDFIKKIMEVGEIEDIELSLKDKAGNPRITSISAHTLYDSKGNLIGIEGSSHDISGHKKVEEVLKENEAILIAAKEKAEDLSRLKTSILNNMSHELRTPLIGIMGFADVLESEIHDPVLNNMITQISSSSKRLSETLNLLLDLSKMESEKLNIEYECINLSEITLKRVANYEGAARVKKLTLQTIIRDNNITVRIDERMYSQILDNLVNNAIKFTSTGGIIVVLDKEIRTVRDGQECFVKLKVIDTGIGVAPENFNLIFEEYRQVSVGLSRSFQGTGLGLTITKRFVELLGGKITIESKLGTGTIFTVILPA